MDEILRKITEALHGIWLRRWIGLAVAWLAALTGGAYVFQTPDKYEASARIYVDTQSMLKPLMAGLAIQPNVEQEVAILSRTLISRPNMEKLVRMTDMDLQAKTTEDRERIIDGLMRTLQIKSVGRDNLYTIGFLHPKPEQAKRVVQSLLSIFVESGLAGKRNDSEQAARFLEEQIKAYEQRLAEAENRLKEFKLRNLDIAGSGGKDYFGSMSALAEQRRQAQLELREAERSRDALKRELASEDPVFLQAPSSQPEVAPEIATPEIDARLDVLTKGLDELLRRYTDEHPDVVGTRRIIKDLEAQRRAEQERLKQELERRRQTMPSAGPQGDRNPVYQQLKVALVEAEAQVAALRIRVADFDQRHARLLHQARMVPEVEAELAQLNRDYGIQKQNYESLVGRREAALMSGEVESATGIADFRIIDPPRVSPNPVAPNRQVLLPLVFLASFCAGIAASFLFSQVKPTFHDNRKLREIAQRPVLGAVSLIPNKAMLARRRRSALYFFGSFGGLLTAYGAAIAFVFVYGFLPF
jgi:polysaccharide chain length determinant protein (PEP-CTERM system associated)